MGFRNFLVPLLISILYLLHITSAASSNSPTTGNSLATSAPNSDTELVPREIPITKDHESLRNVTITKEVGNPDTVTITPNSTSSNTLTTSCKEPSCPRSQDDDEETCMNNHYYTLNEENLAASGVQEWFKQWDASIDKTSPEFLGNDSYYGYFIESWVGPPQKVSCTIDSQYCDMPRCDEIIKGMKGQPKEDKRNVWFVVAYMQNRHKYLSNHYESSLNVGELSRSFAVR